MGLCASSETNEIIHGFSQRPVVTPQNNIPASASSSSIAEQKEQDINTLAWVDSNKNLVNNDLVNNDDVVVTVPSVAPLAPIVPIVAIAAIVQPVVNPTPIDTTLNGIRSVLHLSTVLENRLVWTQVEEVTFATDYTVANRQTIKTADLVLLHRDDPSETANLLDVQPHQFPNVGLVLGGNAAFGYYTTDAQDNHTERLGCIELPPTKFSGIAATCRVRFITTTLPSRGCLFHMSGGWDSHFTLRFEGNGTLHFQVSADSKHHSWDKRIKINSTTVFTSRPEPYEVTAVQCNDGSQKLYVNGVLEAEGPGVKGMTDGWNDCERSINYLGRWMRPDQSSPLLAGLVSFELFDGDVISGLSGTKGGTKDLKEAPKFTFTTSATTIIVPEGNTIVLKDGQTMTNAWYGKDLTQGALVPIENIPNGTRVGNGMGIGDPVPGYPKKLWINIKSISGGDESFVMNFGEYVSKPEKYNWNGSHAVYSGNYGGAFDQDPEKEGWVVFNVSTKTGGIHDLYFSYTAYDSRPCIVRVNGQTVPQTCANNTTGGWGCATIVWSKKPECRIDMGPAGSVTKLEIRSVHFMPHLAEMKFIHVNDNENASAVSDKKDTDKNNFADENKPTQWADAAYQLGGNQEYYDEVMAAPLEDRKAVYGALKREHDKK